MIHPNLISCYENSELQKIYSDFDKIFSSKNPITIGMEVEFFGLTDEDRHNSPINKKDAKWILEDLPLNFTTDYHPYQLELRTDVFENPQEAFKNFKKLWKMVQERTEEGGYKIVRTSYIDGLQYCGTHIHIRYKNHNQNFWKRGICAYPFIISLTDRFKNWDSQRQIYSTHIGIPSSLDKNIIDSNNRNMIDFCVNKYKRTEDGHRFKDLPTLEIRNFDTMETENDYELLLNYIYNIFYRINDRRFSPIFEKNKLKPDFYEIVKNTRYSLKKQIGKLYYTNISKNNMNQVFNMRNLDAIEKMRDLFGILDSEIEDLRQKSWDKILKKLKNGFYNVQDFCEFLNQEHQIIPKENILEIGEIIHLIPQKLSLEVCEDDEISDLCLVERIMEENSEQNQTTIIDGNRASENENREEIYSRLSENEINRMLNERRGRRINNERMVRGVREE